MNTVKFEIIFPDASGYTKSELLAMVLMEIPREIEVDRHYTFNLPAKSRGVVVSLIVDSEMEAVRQESRFRNMTGVPIHDVIRRS